VVGVNVVGVVVVGIGVGMMVVGAGEVGAGVLVLLGGATPETRKVIMVSDWLML